MKSELAKQIVPHLPLAKRGFQVRVPLEEIVNAILYYRKWCTTDVFKEELDKYFRKKTNQN